MTTAVRTLRRATLEDLRAKIDAIDDSLHDLLMRRAGLAADIARLKTAAPGSNGVFFRAGREAAVVRRILGRHRGPFPAAAVVRIWREIVAGVLSLQGELTVAASSPELIEMAREHFGSGSGLRRFASPAAAIRALGQRRATAALAPWPGSTPDRRWWFALAKASTKVDAPRVVAALPVLGERPAAVVLANAAPEPSGDDRTLIVVRGTVTAKAIARALSHARLDGAVIARGDGATLVDVDGFVADDSPSLTALRVALGAKGVTVIGAYAKSVSMRGERA
ncbi:MAG TPA: chorismate mutase [Alphaproteobacteria bacterium]|jgi:chorismate mutase/prephenate dehydratase|nr:chorismate mutase [Alphaproteobacteria bacterium]